MGIKDWLDFCKVPKRRTNSLGELKGKIFAVDASSWMHKILSSWSLGSVPTRLFHQFPPRNMQYVVDTWMTYTMEYLKSFDVQVVLVFDGARNPRKDREDAERGDDIECNIPYLHLSLSLSLSLFLSLLYSPWVLSIYSTTYMYHLKSSLQVIQSVVQSYDTLISKRCF